MRQDLDSLRTEIRDYLETNGFAVFHGFSRALDSLPTVYWDVAQHPDYREFLKVAQQASAKIIVFHQRTMSEEYVDDALDRLEEAQLTRDEVRELERRIRQLRAYEGFTCALELSFDHAGRLFLFDLRTEWYEELNDILDDIDAATPPEDEEQGPIGGYFSNN